ncbi:MAG TPA: protein kinase [Gemmatimonadales bacterium]
MKCSQCGTELSGGSAFCPSCGAATKDPSAATVAISAAPPPEDPLLVAVRDALGQYYAVEKELGRGGMAVVYKGKEKGLEREVAIKVLPPEMALQGGTADRFRREARLAASLEHQNIIPVYRVGEEKNLIYMAMKFVRGRALDSIIEQQGALPIPVVTRILAAAAAGLAHAHEHGVVHRDIKGANILIELDGRPLVADFGIARAMTENSLTASGMVIGTPNFMSPEQCGGSKVGPQSDQYSLGVLGFQMLTGQLPFEADSIMGIIQHHYMTPPPDITAVREGVPQALLDVIYRALAKKPDDRFGHTSEMADALDAVPATVEEKRESLAMLKQLSQGEKVATVRTESLPPLSLTASISGQRASVARPAPTSGAGISGARTKLIDKKGAPDAKQKPKGKGGLIAAVITVLALGGAGAYYGMVIIPQQRAAAAAAAAQAAQPLQPQPTRRETILVAAPPPAPAAAAPRQDRRDRAANPAPAPAPAPAPPAAPVGRGTLIISAGAGCAGAEIQVDGNRVGQGRLSTPVSAGTHTVKVIPESGTPWQTSVTVGAGESKSVLASGLSCNSE